MQHGMKLNINHVFPQEIRFSNKYLIVNFDQYNTSQVKLCKKKILVFNLLFVLVLISF